MRFVLLIGLLLLAGFWGPAFAQAPLANTDPCGIDIPCRVEGGFYFVRLPSGWDGRPRLDALVYFHGWQEQAADIVADPALQQLADTRDLLLVVPQGEGKTWSYPGSPGRWRDEFAFTSAVLEDVARRFPLARERFIAAGFSQGASMVWNLACHMPRRFLGFVPISGGFWEPLPQDCVPAPTRVVHLHGTADGTVPMAGRALRGGRFRQGEIRKGWALLGKAAGCKADAQPLPESARGPSTPLACERPSACGAGAAHLLCLHPGGHEMSAAWLEIGLEKLLALPR